MAKAKHPKSKAKSKRSRSHGAGTERPAVSSVSRHSRAVAAVLVQPKIKTRDPRQKWLTKYEGELGIQPKRHQEGGHVVEARCMFCVAFGREDENSSGSPLFGGLLVQQKRKKTSHTKTFKSFRRDNIMKHLTEQHPQKWAAYNTLMPEDERRATFFRKAPITILLPWQGQCAEFHASADIMDVIARLLSNSSESGFVRRDDDVASVRLSDDFVELEDGDFVLTIQDKLQFETVIHRINTSTSFRAIRRLFVIFGEAIGTVKLGKPSEETIGRYIRYIVVINLSALKRVLSEVWAFSILADGATHRSVGYLDVRVSFELGSILKNMHLLAIPMGTLSHMASNYADLVLDVLFSLGGDALLRKLIGITSDGAATMLGCRQGFAIRMRRASERVGGGGVAMRSCGSHQLNLAIGAFLDCLDKFVCFRSCLAAEISFTRTFETVRATVGQCPTYSTTRWESIYDTCKFLAINYQELKRLKAEKKQESSSCSWWLCLFVVSDVAELVCHCFKIMQYKTATMKVQYDALTALARSLQLKFERTWTTVSKLGSLWTM